MATINSREMVDTIIAGNGWYPGDSMQIVKIIEYTNAWGATAYGFIYNGDRLDRYAPSPYIQNPKTLWEYKLTTEQEPLAEPNPEKLEDILEIATSMLEVLNNLEAKLENLREHLKKYQHHA